MTWILSIGFLLGVVGAFFVTRRVRRSGINPRLILSLLWGPRRRRSESVHLLLCIADHFEPGLDNAPPEVADARVARWTQDYPKQFSEFRDSDGMPPRYTFFYPIDQYEPTHVDALADLCRAGFGEVEVHLHHDDDTAENLRETLLTHKKTMAKQHGLGARDRNTGELVYAFIHGNWALDNSLPDGRWCGVNNELDVLRETGCYADLTLPAYPSPAQTSKINSIYYAVDDPKCCKSHDSGVDVGKGPAPDNALMMIQGPLVLDWKRRKWGILPRVENACIQGNQAPSIHRLANWLKARVQVHNRPDWFFVKLHTHGANEWNQPALLGPAMVNFHRALAQRAQEDPNFHYHYVTAREMYNLAKAAESGWRGSVASARDYALIWEGDQVALSHVDDRLQSAPANLGDYQASS